jgi:uncharacterized protein YkwD
MILDKSEFMQEKPLNKQKSDYDSSLIKPHTVGLLLVFFLAVKVLLTLITPASRPLASDLTTDNILQAVNQQRSLRNLTTLNSNGKLAMAAQSKTDDMQARHYFAHVDPDGHYIWDKIVADGYTPYLELGENLAIEFYDTQSLVSAWMNSPEHRANILNDGFQDQGMGLTFGNPATGQYYSAIANTFGTLAPAAKVKAAQIPSQPEQTNPLQSPAPAPAPAPKTSPKATPKPKTPASQPPAQATTTQTSSQTATTSSSTLAVLPEPVLPRQTLNVAQNQQSNFSLASNAENASTSTSTQSQIPSQPKTAVVGNLTSSFFSGNQANRYLILFAGFILLLLMLSDIKKSVEKKFAHLDKKFNNLIVLLISLVVIAFMYWL